ncbi:GtrA family protein [Candidatus Desulfovibrio trichonymphae]|uniref:Uncharacterized glycosyltransferase n=1 Tax=Candidatus Desulfovibrio trichonymphae TaxID=1725232 RepID=A0A1J1DYW2_9BACT|nr:GtrA family protein [Candidatus Desulfovibrio trichonymphae]BAV92318.1 uncharacterized glycosyltransferase [Candidatus Desulfovibrio trichonymphae]GHU91570.1 hypothetical protein AGMMS49925_06920 [Deltaproteobacteria bacterium]GHU98130.1 hypothetical protein AGMMS50248_04200 [Deltaproteobacteria bacterium]
MITHRWDDLRDFTRALLASRLTRFVMMGGAATFYYVLFGLLFVNTCGLPVLFGNAPAYFVGFFVFWAGQNSWTFQAKVIHKTMLPHYVAVHLTGLGINSVLVWLLMHYKPAMLVAALFVAVSAYLLCNRFVFQNASAGKYA